MSDRVLIGSNWLRPSDGGVGAPERPAADSVRFDSLGPEGDALGFCFPSVLMVGFLVVVLRFDPSPVTDTGYYDLG